MLVAREEQGDHVWPSFRNETQDMLKPAMKPLADNEDRNGGTGDKEDDVK